MSEDAVTRIRAYAHELAAMAKIGLRAGILGGTARPSAETSEVRFFAADELPEDMTLLQRAMVELAFADPREAVFQ